MFSLISTKETKIDGAPAEIIKIHMTHLIQGRKLSGSSRTQKLLEIEQWLLAYPQLLNTVIPDLNISFLFRRAIQKINGRRSILQIFVHQELKLEVQNRAKVILALYPILQHKRAHQSGKKLARLHMQAAFLSCPVADIPLLKSILDSTGTSMNLCRLLFHELDGESRGKILAHFNKVVSLRSPLERRKRKILSDIDDTMTCSGGAFLAGIDQSHPQAIIYPGVLEFYKELDLGFEEGSGDGQWQIGRPGNLVFLSARPHIPGLDAMEKHCFELFRILSTSRLYTTPDMLFGDLSGALGDRAKAIKKAENFKNYRQIYPEYQFVFIGDNGQGDAMAAESMKKEATEDIEIFIHQVKDVHQSAGYNETWAKLGFVFFLNYIDAALEAVKKDLIHPKGLRRIMIKAKNDFLAFTPTTFMQFLPRVKELNSSIGRANKYLEQCKLEPVDTITFSTDPSFSSFSLSSSLSSSSPPPPPSSPSPSFSLSSSSGSGSASASFSLPFSSDSSDSSSSSSVAPRSLSDSLLFASSPSTTTTTAPVVSTTTVTAPVVSTTTVIITHHNL